VVRAPISGIVAKRMVNEGERVSFDAALLQIVDLRQLELQAWVAPQAVSLLQVGQTVNVRVEGFAEPIKGRLSRVLPAVDASTRQLGIVVQVANDAQKLKTGLNASANVSLAARNALTVPKAALTNNNGDYYVWQLQDNKVQRKRVSIGAQHDEAAMVELLSGVDAGATLLLGRYDSLKDGQAVKLVEKKAAAPAAPSASNASATKL
jgi:membrane fusion protein, multidrug efflux system